MKIDSMSPSSGRMMKEDGTYVNIADVLGGEDTGMTRDIEKYSPMSGRMIKEDGTVVNVAESIGGGGSGGTTNYNDLTNKPSINGVTLEGDKTAADFNIQSKTTQTDHGTADTTFTLPPNQYHVWDEVATLTLTLAAEEAGVVNEYHFAFDSGDTATTLSLPEGIQTDIVVEPNTHYECSVIDNYMTFRDWPVEVSA